MNTKSERALFDLGLFLIRLVLAAVFIFHGGQKLFGLFEGHGLQATTKFMEGLNIPMPAVSAVVVGIVEFFGGIALAMGLLTRLFAFMIAFDMTIAILKVHHGSFGLPSGMEFVLMLGVTSLGLALIGPGRISLDHAIFRKRTVTTTATA
ncbi:MAG: DoxX family protein [Phycisphaerales bacterium]|jgi:putative oxidoreductase|nr:DoxX family protein [Phycisphaerales bacterium]